MSKKNLKDVQLSSSVLYAVADPALTAEIENELKKDDPTDEEFERAVAKNEKTTDAV